ncbi:Kelch-type beta propeller [Penicillium chermesinum]|nr:Kelch-type beta propeller [Penicillium chermesinum]
MVDRTSHTVGYVPGTSTLVVVGSDGSTTWTISTKSDSTSMDIEGGTPGGMGPVTTPTILPWNDTSIALVSGDGGNGAVSIFDSQASHWVDSYAALPAGAVKASSHLALISDSDGNYVLQDFNMAAKPNTVTSYQLYKKGKPQNPAKEVGGSSSKRSLDDLPAYNGSFAGETTRSDYALAQSGNQPGLVVIGSGDDDNALSIFDQSSNGWANATELFYGSPNKQSPSACYYHLFIVHLDTDTYLFHCIIVFSSHHYASCNITDSGSLIWWIWCKPGGDYWRYSW